MITRNRARTKKYNRRVPNHRIKKSLKSSHRKRRINPRLLCKPRPMMFCLWKIVFLIVIKAHRWRFIPKKMRNLSLLTGRKPSSSLTRKWQNTRWHFKSLMVWPPSFRDTKVHNNIGERPYKKCRMNIKSTVFRWRKYKISLFESIWIAFSKLFYN